MATSQEFHDYIMERLLRIGDFSSRKMMGEYCIYYQDKMVAEICDNQFLLKPTPSALKLLPNAKRAYPYKGSKTLMVLLTEMDNTELLLELFTAMHSELPAPKKKK